MPDVERRPATTLAMNARSDVVASRSGVPAHELSVLATVAHELRGPLTALATSSELLAEDFQALEPEQVKGMLASMHRSAVWLQGLVENLLCAASIREGRLQLISQRLSLAEVLEDVQALVEPLLAQNAQSLDLSVPSVLPEMVGDRRRLGQVLLNLILNASKFGPREMPIEVIVKVRREGLRVVVADRGPGIAPDQAAHLFEPYYRGPQTTANGQDGVGLGLSIVKSIVEAHGGLVGVESRRGGGASFWFSLPILGQKVSAPSHLSLVSSPRHKGLPR
jgi:signal transduction histidine kinase